MFFKRAGKTDTTSSSPSSTPTHTSNTAAPTTPTASSTATNATPFPEQATTPTTTAGNPISFGADLQNSFYFDEPLDCGSVDIDPLPSGFKCKMDQKTKKKLLEDNAPLKKYATLSKFTESANDDEIRVFYQENYTVVYKIYLDALQGLDHAAKQKTKDLVKTADILALNNILKKLFIHVRSIIQRKWQQRSLTHILECLMEPRNTHVIRRSGLELLLYFLDIMQDQADLKLMDLCMSALEFGPFIPSDKVVRIPTFQIRILSEEEKLKCAKATNALTEDESLELFTMFFDFFKKAQVFEFWWAFFKARVAPILYPNECQSLDLLSKVDDMGFREKCPYKIHMLVINMLLSALEDPKKSQVLYATDKDIYLVLLIFRQSFLLPYFEYELLFRMLKTYRAWICKDNFLYSWPDIMERSRNTYFRIFIDNLAQTFYMRCGELYFFDLHVDMCQQVLEMFYFFSKYTTDKLEWDTWSDLLKSLIRIVNHLYQLKNSNNPYDVEFSLTLERPTTTYLFLLWLKACPNDSPQALALWQELHECIHVNYHESSISTFWRNTVLNMSNLVLHNVFELPEEHLQDVLNYDCELQVFELKPKRKGKTSKTRPKSTVKPFVFNPKEVLTSMKQDTLLLQWHKFIEIFGSKNMNIGGELHTRKVHVLSEVIELFMQLSALQIKVPKGTTAPPFIHSPEANKLLDLFGEWLFEACSREDAGFLSGRCSAYVSLCRIFSQKCSQPIKQEYLAEFYRVIHLGLTSNETKIIEAILLNSSRLFGLDHRGAKILIPYYVKAAEKRLQTPGISRELRTAALRVIISVICFCYYNNEMVLPNVEARMKAKTATGDSATPSAATAVAPAGAGDASYFSTKGLRPKICQILLGAISDSSYPDCQIMCIWGLHTIVIRELFSQETTSSVKFSIDCILNHALNANDRVALAAHDAIVSMAYNDLFSRLNDDTVTKVITALGTAIVTQVREANSIRVSRSTQSPRVNIISNLYYTLNDVILHTPFRIVEKQASVIFETVTLGLAFEKIPNATGDVGSRKTTAPAAMAPVKTGEIEREVADAAEAVLSHMLNTLNHFPLPTGPSFMSSNISEFGSDENAGDDQSGSSALSDAADKELSALQTQGINMQHFVFNNTTLITLMENPITDTESVARIILRDITGRYCWETRLTYTPEQRVYKPGIRDIISSTATKDSTTNVDADIDDGYMDDDAAAIVDDTTGGSAPTVVTSTTASPVKDDSEGSPSNAGRRRATMKANLPLLTTKTSGSDVEDNTPPGSTADVDVYADEENEIDEAANQAAAEASYPLYTADIDTDSVDMLQRLVQFNSSTFTELTEFIEKSVVPIAGLNIDFEPTSEQIDTQSKLEEEVLTHKIERPKFVTVLPAAPLLEGNIYRTIRSFLSNMGYLSAVNRPTFSRVDVNQRFYRTLKQLDKLPERETIKVGLIYVANGQETQRDILKNETCSNLYAEFVYGLGWMINPATHKGFLGGLDRNLTTGSEAPYFSNSSLEVIFHDIAKMPTKANDEQQIHKKRHVGNDIVHIVWSEHDRDYRPWTITSQFNFVHIVVYPLHNGLFRIQIFSKDEVPLIGPLLDGMVVDKVVLAQLVRTTSIFANRAVRFKNEGYKRPFATRRDMIDEIVERFKNDKISNEEFLRPLFIH